MKRRLAIDVSAAQGRAVDWKAIGAFAEPGSGQTIDIAILRASDGGSVDPTFSLNLSTAMTDAPLLILGAYGVFEWFLDPQKQVAFLDHVVGELRDGELPLALDVEGDTRKDRSRPWSVENTWIEPRAYYDKLCVAGERLRAYTGRKRSLLYTNAWYWRTFLGGIEDVAICEFFVPWLATYPGLRARGTLWSEALAELAGAPALPAPFARANVRAWLWQFDGDGGLTLPSGLDVDFSEALVDIEAAIASTLQVPVVADPVDGPECLTDGGQTSEGGAS